MSAFGFVGCAQSVAVAAGAVGYSSIASGSIPMVATEAQAQRKSRTAQTRKAMCFHLSSNTLSGDLTVSFRINGVDGNLVKVAHAGQTGFFITPPNISDALLGNGTELINIKIAAAAGTGSATIRSVGILCVNSGGGISCEYGCNGSLSVTGNSTDFFLPLAGTISSSATEAQRQHKLDVGGAGRDLQCYVIANARSTPSSLTLRASSMIGGSTLVTIPIGAGVTGFLEDHVNSYVYGAGDLAGLKLTTGLGGGALTLGFAGITLDSANAKKFNLLGFTTTGATAAAEDYTPFGNGVSGGAANCQHELEAWFKLTKPRAFITANNSAEPRAFHTMINAVAGNASGSIAPNTSGVFTTDGAGVDMITAHQALALQLDGSVSGTVTPGCFSALLENMSARTRSYDFV